MSLKKYQQKRNFKKTPEPAVAGRVSKSKHLYIIQKHAASHLHYDFRLEMDGVLKSWAVPKGPSLDPQVKRLAVQVEDHPVSYGSFEGIIPHGQYGGGTVMLWDKGKWEPDGDYKKGDITFILKGEKLKGAWKLVQIKRDPKNWLLMKLKDEYARAENEYDVLTQQPLSVSSGRDMAEIADGKKLSKKNKTKKTVELLGVKKSKMPAKISPELATLVDKAPVGKKWLHEIKFDGYRLICVVQQSKVRMFTRNHHDWTAKIPAIATAIKNLNLTNTILDGELVALDDQQHSNFQLLQNTLNEKLHKPLFYFVFDVIYHDGCDLSAMPLLERKKILKSIIDSHKEKNIQFSEYVIGNGPAIFVEACKLKLEGIISKDVQSTYVQKRTRQWLKVKCVKRQEFIVGGYTKPAGSRQYFGSLLLGFYTDDNELQYCGHVGTGFTAVSLQAVYKLLKANEINKMPFSTKPTDIKDVKWVQPKIVVEVEFNEWTREGILRHPSFKGLRKDKSAQQVTLELVKPLNSPKKTTSKKNGSILNYHFTHLARILYPEQGITKQNLAEFYLDIGRWILPYIINRPLTLVRCPQGGFEDCFFQKHADEQLPAGIYTFDIFKKNKKEKYLYIKDIQGLMALVQMGVLEIHPWGCQVDDVDKPDMITFDLDPGPEVKWSQVIKTAMLIKNQLNEIGLKCFVKTSGGKGLHIVLPIKRERSWAEVKAFASALVDSIVAQDPTHCTRTVTKSKRQGKIFIDYLRNTRGATAVAAYSTRARTNAPVSTPLSWDELTAKIKSTSYNLSNLRQRLQQLKADPWRQFYKLKQSCPVL